MARYFNYFPKTLYNLDDDTNTLNSVTNIIARFAFEEKLKENSAAFYKYALRDGDTPEIVARKYYDNSERHWIVLLFNNIIDPQWEWPLDDKTFNEFVDKKYSAPEYADTANTGIPGFTWARNTNNEKKYFKTVTTITNVLETVEKFEVDNDTYDTIDVSTNNYVLADNTTVTIIIEKEKQTYYDYEQELNESRREIKLLKPEFVPLVEKEFKKIIKQ